MSDTKVPSCLQCGLTDRMEHFPKLSTVLSYARHDAAGKLTGGKTEEYDAGEDSRWYCDRCRRWLSSFAPLSPLHPSVHPDE